MSELEEKQIRPNDAFQKMKSKNSIYLDVRTEAEFEKGRPKFSINIPVMNSTDGGMVLNENFVKKVKDKLLLDQEIFVGCRMGGRSTKACKLLLKAGFKDISNVIGGYIGNSVDSGWSSLNLPVEP